jgi:hypothetical protein
MPGSDYLSNMLIAGKYGPTFFLSRFPRTTTSPYPYGGPLVEEGKSYSDVRQEFTRAPNPKTSSMPSARELALPTHSVSYNDIREALR